MPIETRGSPTWDLLPETSLPLCPSLPSQQLLPVHATQRWILPDSGCSENPSKIQVSWSLLSAQRTPTRRAPLSTGCMPSAFPPGELGCNITHDACCGTAMRSPACTNSVPESVAAWHASLLRTALRCDVLGRVGDDDGLVLAATYCVALRRNILRCAATHRAALRCDATCRVALRRTTLCCAATQRAALRCDATC